MAENKMFDMLCQKMMTEQDRYCKWFLSQNKLGILQNVHQFTIHNRLIEALESTKLSEEQAQALLEAPKPLEKVFDYFCNYAEPNAQAYLENMFAPFITRCADEAVKTKKFKDNLEILAQLYEHSDNTRNVVKDFVEKTGYDTAKETIDALAYDSVLFDVTSKLNAEGAKLFERYNGFETEEIHELCTSFAERIGPQHIPQLTLCLAQLTYARQIASSKKDDAEINEDEDRDELINILWEKMTAEQNEYKEWLLSQPKEEILNHTYEYTMREDIIYSLDEGKYMSKAEIEALLKSPCPLAEVYREFEKRECGYMETIVDSVRTCAKGYIDKDAKEKDLEAKLKLSERFAEVYAKELAPEPETEAER